ncbi:ADAM metallopeptidase with thrombospondin type 1 motif, 13 [Desmophyllum pertusum]|uniref:ADAM metallopeptidase with thrombospondin type 1 motif, 13 n=1 Tax=Desmophyllum pertusum TaxID=174260 RepID=A0A9W9YJP1_9CNID|nr:ADAM metallopeptidase with thrombospondin type 1 motif, 13 [Desmophyllum pertusum]
MIGFTCSCTTESTYNCAATPGDPCSPDPCLNGGTCSADPSSLLGGFKCSCSLGYIGFNCGVEKEYLGFNCGTLKDDKCKPNPCANDGNCTRARDNPKGFTCNCTSAYTGDICENKIVHGNWSVWSPWPNCNKPCNNGSKTRKRLCNNPEPAFGGKDCDGPAIDSEPCNFHTCPAEEINYNVKLTDEVWNNKLANPNTKDYTDLKDKIKNDVKLCFG